MSSKSARLVVGLAVAAGELASLRPFLQAIPPDCAIAFLVVPEAHLSQSPLNAEVLRSLTPLPVVEVDDVVPTAPSTCYLAPHGSTLALHGDKITRVPLEDARGLPLNALLTSLAQERPRSSVGILFTGASGDGWHGLTELKAAGGMVMAGVPTDEAIPALREALAPMEVDYLMSPESLAHALMDYVREVNLADPEEDRTRRESPAVAAQRLRPVLALLKARTGHDFSHYKPTTVVRRMERRMHLEHCADVPAYLQHLQANPVEVARLFKELLINVTSFFRDPEAFEFLRQSVIPELVARRAGEQSIRLWVAGCSTGEEAYSLAILLREHLDEVKSPLVVQVFATDLDGDSIERARVGNFPATIAANVSPERLERFFIRNVDRYQIKPEIREMLVFAKQNITSDPPFTNLDFLSCRNLLIYLDAEIQQRLLPLFHYTLRPGGIMFLGSSESLGSATAMFDSLEKKWKIFRRRTAPVMPPPHPAAFTRALQLESHRSVVMSLPAARKPSEGGLAQLAERAMVQHLLPPTVLMNERGEVVHIHGRTGLFLEPSPGSPSQNNIYNMAREGLHLDLTVAVREALAQSGDEVVHRGVIVRSNAHHTVVNLRVRQLLQPEALRGLVMVSFESVGTQSLQQENSTEPAESSREVALAVESPRRAARERQLERELQQVKEVYQRTVEELETTNEELKSTNEELQSTNEELQSTNEELETSKEEMQSLNEELHVVNGELESKIEELSSTNDDMKNLLNGSDIATLFLGNDLTIKRFTEQATRVIRVIPSDIGRPVGDLVSRLQHDRLVEDARQVLATLVYRETEVQSKDGRWYLMRILPYRTADNVIDGLVVTFVDITMVRDLQQRTQRMMSILQNSPTTLFSQGREDGKLRYTWLSGHLFSVTPELALGKCDDELLPDEEARRLRELKLRVLETGRVLRKVLTLSDGVGARRYQVYLEPVAVNGAKPSGLVGAMSQIREEGEDEVTTRAG